MEVIVALLLIYGGIWFLGWLFGEIGKWNNERKANIRDEVAQEVFSQTDITSQLIDDYKKKLDYIGYTKSQDEYKYFWQDILSGNRKTYRHLVGVCPSCHEGDLRVIDGKYGKFLGCTKYPTCKYTKDLDVAKNEYKEKANKDFFELFSLAYSN